MAKSLLKFERKPFSLGSLQGLEILGVYKDGRDFAERVFMSDGLLCHFTAAFSGHDGKDIREIVRNSFDSFQPGPAAPLR